jgi:hypothetical protein
LNALEAARRVLEFDYAAAYRQLVSGDLPAEYSPLPTLDAAAQLLDLTIFFVERHAGIRQKLDKAQQELELTAPKVKSARKKELAATPAN